MKILVDTNILYGFLDAKDADAGHLLSLKKSKQLYVSDISIVEWVVRNGDPNKGDLKKLQAGLSLIKDGYLNKATNPYHTVDMPTISAFLKAHNLDTTKNLHRALLQKRISLEHEWLRYVLVVALGAYVSHFAKKMFGNKPNGTGNVATVSHALLASNLDYVSDTLKSSLEEGYKRGDAERYVNDAIDEIRTCFSTALLLMFSSINGVQHSEKEIKKTLRTENFRKFIASEAKAGNFTHFASLARADLTQSHSSVPYTVDYMFSLLHAPLNLGANHNKNDINDSFIVGHLADPEVHILTRDKKMIKALSTAPFRPAITIAAATAMIKSR